MKLVAPLFPYIIFSFFFNVVIIFKVYFLKGFSMPIGSSGFVTKACLTLVTPWTVVHQAPLSKGFPSQEYWSGGASRPRDQTPVSCIAEVSFYAWATRES